MLKLLETKDPETGYPFYISKVEEKHIDDLRSTKSFSCDIETTALIPKQGQIRLIQVYLPRLTTVVIVDLWEESTLNYRFVQLLLKRLADKSCTKIWHNGLFDIGWFYYHYEVMSVNNFDTMIASQIHKAGKFFAFSQSFRSTPNSLKFLAYEHGITHDKDIDHNVWKMPTLDWKAVSYAARDAFYTFALAKHYKEALSFCPDVVKAEMGSIPGFVYMNHIGLPCHKPTLEARLQQYTECTERLEKELTSTIKLDPKASRLWYDAYYATRGLPKKLDTEEKLIKECQKTEFKPGSSQSVAKWLLSLVPVERLLKTDNKTGKTTISTDKPTLFVLNTDLHVPAMKTLINYRSIKGAASKFQGYLNSYDEENQSIHVSYTVLARQGTGRSSSGKKASKDDTVKYHNAQNFSKYLDSHVSNQLESTRSIVRARPGYKLYEFDAPASHLTIATYLSQDPYLVESKKTGIKVHYYTLAGILSHIEGRKVEPLEAKRLVEDKTTPNHPRYLNLYRLSKTVIYAFLNKAGAKTLQGTFFKLETFVSLEDCQTFLEACDKQYAGLSRYQNRVFNEAKQTLKAHYVNGKYLGHFATSRHLDGAITYHQAKIKASAVEKIVEKYEDQAGEEFEVDVTEEYIKASVTNLSKADLYLKISDVVAAKWLRPEATILKKALSEAFEYQLESGLDFRLINFSHDSFMFEIREDLVPTVAPYLFDCINRNFKRYIPDFEPEFKGADGYKECELGDYWK